MLGIQSWTGSPPAVGQAFDVTGTVTAVGSDTLTITLNTVGGVGGTLTVGAAFEPPKARTGASANLPGDPNRSDHLSVDLSGDHDQRRGGDRAEQFRRRQRRAGQSGHAERFRSGDPAARHPVVDRESARCRPGVQRSGTVTAVSSGALTVTLKSEGGVGGVLTFTPGGGSSPTTTGASVELGGTRTGPNTYLLTEGSVSQGGSGYGWSTGSAAGPSGPSSSSGSSSSSSSSGSSSSSSSSSSSGSSGPSQLQQLRRRNGSSSASGPGAPGSQPTIMSWTGSPPAVGQTFDLKGTISTIGSDTVTVTLEPGAVSGAVTFNVALPAAGGHDRRLGRTRRHPDGGGLLPAHHRRPEPVGDRRRDPLSGAVGRWKDAKRPGPPGQRPGPPNGDGAGPAPRWRAPPAGARVGPDAPCWCRNPLNPNGICGKYGKFDRNTQEW